MYFRRIADLRVDSDLTQRAVAAHLNMNLEAYLRYEKGIRGIPVWPLLMLEVYRRNEKGIREIPVWALLKLAELYHTSTDYLLGRTDDPRPPRA